MTEVAAAAVTVAKMEPVVADLSGVPETLLWNLGRRVRWLSVDLPVVLGPL